MEREREDSLQKAGIRILEGSRNELYMAMRFLDSALGMLKYKMDKKTFFAGTDGENIYFQPRFLAERFAWHPILVNRAYLHMVLHLLFRHLFEEEEREEELWNLACDMAVEYVIDTLELPVVAQVVPNNREQWYDRLEKEIPVLSAQAIYHFLQKEKLEGEALHGAAEFLVDDHSYWKFRKKKKEQEKGEEKQEKKKSGSQKLRDRQEKEKAEEIKQYWQRISEKTQTKLEVEKGKTVPVHLLQQLDMENREKFDYKSFLKKFAERKEVLRTDLDTFDLGFYNYGLEVYGNLPLIEPLEYKEVMEIEEFVIAIDTSGSCSGSLVKEFLEQTCAVLFSSETFSRKINIHILQCDDEIQEDIVLKQTEDWKGYIKDFQVKGMGQTDFRPVFSYVEQLLQKKELKKLKGLLYFTDGYGIYPQSPPPYDTVFVFMDKYYRDREVPVWAMKLILPA